jgi:3'-phosphoadenosine 5'-phosphosulfate sulfotransferase (PAPS reductase)/FAD synthetase
MLTEADYLYARLPAFKRRVERAKALIAEVLAMSKNPYIAFSGGKDSAVTLHMARSIDPSVVAIWSDDEWNLPETMELMILEGPD